MSATTRVVLLQSGLPASLLEEAGRLSCHDTRRRPIDERMGLGGEVVTDYLSGRRSSQHGFDARVLPPK
ncbi:hypothetical protein LZ30DRAFT_730295 [Colletotrichum cereale]|nr:hypothetical protein LZ30DRAFT_730295 [Colletotrichum cereale]